MVLLRAGQAVPNAPQLPALYGSAFLVAVSVDAASSMCTNASGVKEICKLVNGTLPSPTWVNSTTTGSPGHCDNVVSKVSSSQSRPAHWHTTPELPHRGDSRGYKVKVKVSVNLYRGRPRRRWTDDIRDWMGSSVAECTRMAQEREQWCR